MDSVSNINSRSIDNLQGSLFELYTDQSKNCKVNEYSLNGIVGSDQKIYWMDFQTLNLMASLQRAKRIEEQVPPQANIISERNDFLEILGEALAECSSIEAKFKSDDDPDKTYFSGPENSKLQSTMRDYFNKSYNNQWYIYELKECSQLLKSKIDALNADAQQDMTRLQGLMDKRDQGFTLASDMMSTDSDTIGSIIRNITP